LMAWFHILGSGVLIWITTRSFADFVAEEALEVWLLAAMAAPAAEIKARRRFIEEAPGVGRVCPEIGLQTGMVSF